MAEICREVVTEKEALPSAAESSAQAARRKRMEIRKVKFVGGVPTTVFKKARLSISPASFSRENSGFSDRKPTPEDDDRTDHADKPTTTDPVSTRNPPSSSSGDSESVPRYGVSSVCGRRREMEDAVAIHLSFLENNVDQHFFGVYDGHGCSHVARRCEDRLHLLVKEEMIDKTESDDQWRNAMERSFSRMDEELKTSNQQSDSCKCELHAAESYGVGSTAVAAVVTPDKIVVANCGDSRAVLCQNGKAVPLSNDHKPDRPDELNRIEAAGGRVVYWEGARVCGILAMSRAIGDNYLKPYVSCEPEVTITERRTDDECLILASDGLWDVVSNETACGLAMMCLKGKGPSADIRFPPTSDASGYAHSDKACSDASLLLTKLALARRSMDNISVVVVDLRANESS